MDDRRIMEGLETWLRAQPRFGQDIRIVANNVPKTGFSADTLLIDVGGEGLATVRLVVRIERDGRDTFLDASIAKQARMMEQLHRHGIPVPRMVGWETDKTAIGAKFLVMERVDGVSLPMHPSYHGAGLLYDLDEATRRATWIDALQTIARINRLPWQADFAILHDRRHGPAGLEGYLGWLVAWRDMACAGRAHPVIDRAIDYLLRERPVDAPAELLWGDSNPGNFLFHREGMVAAALDFEASAIGPAEIDLSWWFFVDDMVGAGHDLPPGIPDRAEQIAIFAMALGRPVRALDYFARLSGVRMSLVMAQTVRNLVADNRLDGDNRGWLANPASSKLAELMHMSDPGPLDDYMQMVSVMNRR